MTNTTTTKTAYTVTLIVAEGVEITSKQVFTSMDEVYAYIGREVVADDGTITVKGQYRINALTA